MKTAPLLGELLHVLTSKDGEEKMTRQEGEVLLDWKSKTLKKFSLAGALGTGLVWMASRKLGTINRISLAGGAGFVTGYWTLGESVDSFIDQVLGMDGSRMQHELRKIILQRYGDDPQKMMPFSKHFYCEEIYNESNPEYPRSVYRQRNSYIDDQKIANRNIYGGSDADKHDESHQQRNDDRNSIGLKGPYMDAKQVRISPHISMLGYGDPFDVLFGHPSVDEEVNQPNESGVAAKVQSRSQKRAHRRHRMRHRHRESMLLGEAQLHSG